MLFIIHTNKEMKNYMCESAILTLTNETALRLIEEMLSQVEDDVVEFVSVDNVMNTEQATYHVEFSVLHN